MDYGDWRDNINPDLLKRLWEKKGRPGTFIEHTPYGIDFLYYDLKGSVLKTTAVPVNYKMFLDWSQSGG